LKDTGQTNYSSAELIVYINEAVRALMRRIVLVFPDYWLRTNEYSLDTQDISNGIEDYYLPVDFYHAVMVVRTDADGNETVLKPISPERGQDVDADGYWLIGDAVRLAPVPDEDVIDGYNLYYVSVPGEVSAGAETVPLSDTFEDAIKMYVLLKCKARQEEKMADFAAFYKMTQDALDIHMSKTNTSDTDAGVHIPRRWWI
jgi:hypothetical protein